MSRRSVWITSSFIIFAVAVLAVLSGCSDLPANAAVSVNGTIITRDDVDNRIRIASAYQALPDTASEEYDRIKRGTADQLASEMVERLEAESRGISVSAEEVADIVDQVVEDTYLGSVQKMEDDFAMRGVTIDDLRQQILRTILHQKLLESIRAEVPVTDEEVQAEYEKNKANYVYAEKRQVRQVVTADEASANAIAARINAGEDMAKIAGELSIDSKTKKDGGFLGLVTRDQLSPTVGEVVFAQPLRQASPAFKAELGWYVTRVEMIAPASNITFEQQKDKLKELMSNQRLAERYKVYAQEVKDRYEIEFADDYEPREDTGTSTTATEPESGIEVPNVAQP